MTSDNAAKQIADTLFQRLADAVVIDASDLKVEVKHASASSAVVALAPPQEAGNLIGRRGRTARAFKVIAAMVSAKHGWQVRYSVSTPPGDNPPQASRPQPAGNWNMPETRTLLEEVLAACLREKPEVIVSEFTYQTTFEVVLADSEPVPPVEVLAPQPLVSDYSEHGPDKLLKGDDAFRYAVQVLFNAAGHVFNRPVFVVMVRRVPPPQEHQQPATADGKYAKELTP